MKLLTPRRSGLLSLAALIALGSGCTTMKVKPLVERSPDSCPYHDQQQGLANRVHPVTHKREVKEIFRTDLRARGILPILVVAENRNSSASSYWRRRT